MSEVIVSVVIPTKNRRVQLLSTLSAQSSMPGLGGIELVIADNSAEPLLDEDIVYLKSRFPNLKYVHDSGERDILKNFSEGLVVATGEFLMFIGDDDFFLPEIIEASLFAKKENFDCVIYEPDRYYWKSCIFVERGLKYGPGSLIKSGPKNNTAIDVDYQLKKCSRNGFLTIEALPRAYHGLIRRKCLTDILGSDGLLYGGSPDISMAVN